MTVEAKESFTGLHGELTQKVIGVFYEVSNELGHGFLESVYRRSMLIALREAGLKALEEVPVPVSFHGENVGTFYADLVVEGILVLELKTADEIAPAYEAQLLHYLRASRMEVGLVLAFGQRAKLKRLTLSNERKKNHTQSQRV